MKPPFFSSLLRTCPDGARQLRRGAPRRRAPGHFLQESSIISSSFEGNDLQLIRYPMGLRHPLKSCHTDEYKMSHR